MLKLVIADDEKIIRETISTFIDWNALGIEIVGVCENGIEAFDCVMDENPDIVMTDIKMPGLSGIELIEKIQKTKLSTEFIILSGYDEFKFAQAAMKHEVRHYLLKPCNEDEIIQVVMSCAAACLEKFKTKLIKIMLDDAKSPTPHLSYVEMTEYMLLLNRCSNREELEEPASQIMSAVFQQASQTKYNDCVEKVMEYIDTHLSDSSLSLKWIAENYLFMNADYVSKQFIKQTGCKFSTYLTTARIKEAKRLLLNNSDSESPYTIAEKVGFGNNPQYFSQIFKKYTHMTPSAYLKTMAGL